MTTKKTEVVVEKKQYPNPLYVIVLTLVGLLLFLNAYDWLSAKYVAFQDTFRDPRVSKLESQVNTLSAQLTAQAPLTNPQPKSVDQPQIQQDKPAQPQVAKPAPQAVTGVCPTEREFAILTGVIADLDTQGEPCMFHWRGDPQTVTATFPCPNGWACTLGQADPRQTYQYVGQESLPAMQIFSGTWRLVSLYPVGDAVRNPCQFLAKVNDEGRNADPQWDALPGNFSCP